MMRILLLKKDSSALKASLCLLLCLILSVFSASHLSGSLNIPGESTGSVSPLGTLCLYGPCDIALRESGEAAVISAAHSRNTGSGPASQGTENDVLRTAPGLFSVLSGTGAFLCSCADRSPVSPHLFIISYIHNLDGMKP